MVAFALNLSEAHALLRSQDRMYFHGALGIIPPPHPDPEIGRAMTIATYEGLLELEEFNYESFAYFLYLLDNTEIEFITSIIRPYDEIPKIDTSNFPTEFGGVNIEHLYRQDFRKISSIVGRAEDQYYTIIRDGELFFFICETIKPEKFDQVIELLEHAIGKENPISMQPINISVEIAKSLASPIKEPPAKVTTEHGVNAKEAGFLNQLLSIKNLQKAIITLGIKDFSSPQTTKTSVDVLDFEDKGRMISTIYTGYDGNQWKKFISGSNKDLEVALMDLCSSINVDWYTYHR